MRNVPRAITSLAAVVFAVFHSAGLHADDKDDEAAQQCLDRMFDATRRGDAAAMTALLEPAARKRASAEHDKPQPWPEGSKWATLHRHVEGNWGLFWVKTDFGPSKEPTPAGLSEAEIAVLRRGYSETKPVLLHRVDAQWCFVFAGFAPAEIEEIFYGRSEPQPPWMFRDYLDWVVESWRTSPEAHPIELDKPSVPVDVSPEKPAAFLVELAKVVRLRAVVTSNADVEPSVSISSPAGGGYGSSHTKRRAVGTCELTTGPLLLVVRTKKAGSVIVAATAAPEPVRLGLGAPLGPIRLLPGDTGEFRVTVPEPADVAFAAMPVDGRIGAEGFGVAAVTYRTSSRGRELESESGCGGLSTTAHVEKSAVFKVDSRRDADVEMLVAAVPRKGTPDVTVDRPAEIDIEPGRPRFLRLARADWRTEITLTGTAKDSGAAFVRLSVGDGDERTVGIVVHASSPTHARVALAKR